MCCGQKRSALRRGQATATTAKVRPGMPTSVSRPALISQPTPGVLQNVSAGFSKPASGAPHISTPPASVNLHYLENSPIRVRGPVTGRQYDFSGVRPVQAVDTRDASALLRKRFFRPLR